jgi:hypothetical protein
MQVLVMEIAGFHSWLPASWKKPLPPFSGRRRMEQVPLKHNPEDFGQNLLLL